MKEIEIFEAEARERAVGRRNRDMSLERETRGMSSEKTRQEHECKGSRHELGGASVSYELEENEV
jgi:hypothetical protein